MTKDLRYKNLAVIDPLFSPPIDACDHIALNEDGDSGQSVALDTDNALEDRFLLLYDVATKRHIILGRGELGDTIILNGTFATTVDDWIAYGTDAPTWDSGKLKLTSVSGAYEGTNQYQINVIDLDATALYKVNFTYHGELSDANVLVRAGTSRATATYYNQILTMGTQQDIEFEFNANGTNHSFNIEFLTNNAQNKTIYIDNVSLKKVSNQLDVGTTHTMETSFSNAVPLDAEPDSNDLALLDNDLTLIQKLLDGSLTTGLSFSASNVKHYYACCEGTLGSTTIRDTVGETDATITGHTDNCNDYFANVSYGLPTTRLMRNDDGEVESVASDYTAQFKSDGSNLPIGFKPNIPEYTLIFPYSGELQTFDADTKKIASSVDSGWTDNSDHTYTGSTATGDIVGISAETSGEVYVLYTLSNVTAGSVEGNDSDGVYSFNETLSASLNLSGVGFTGTVTINSILPLSTKTQQDQIRCITHSESTSTDTYRINHAEQDTAILPDSDTAMTQSDIALLGYADTITECLGNAEGYSYAMTTAQQLTRLNEIIDANFNVLTHPTTGEPLLDENGLYMYNR